uniref:ECT2 PH domain-containing protein n=1 Tax=Amphimedon queenslandica TaxID=400682 RepID=A0A1X7SR43_AMPQE
MAAYTWDKVKSFLTAREQEILSKDFSRSIISYNRFYEINDFMYCEANISSKNTSNISFIQQSVNRLTIAKIRSGHGFVAMKDSYKPYRHLEFLTYSNIRSVIDFTDSEDVVNGFGLLVHWSDDPQERLLTFKINGDSSIKTELINKISQMMCTSNCAPSPVSVGSLLRLKHGL